jgi:hypothetical protein
MPRDGFPWDRQKQNSSNAARECKVNSSKTLDQCIHTTRVQKSSGRFHGPLPNHVLMDMIKWGGIPFSALKVGGKGDCTSFVLLGR